MLGMILGVLLAANGALANADFANGLEAWRVEAGIARVSVGEGGVLDIAADAVEGYPRVVQDFPAEPGALYGAAATARDAGITGGYGAYMTIEFLGADGKRIHFEQSSPALAGGEWTPLVARSVAPAGTARGMLCLVLRGKGTAQFRAPALSLLEPPAPGDLPETLDITLGEPLNSPFLGFGVEDDGWLANTANAAKGVTPEDIALVHDRVAWLNPALVRMFFWYKDFNPSGDWTTFDFDSDNMQSHCKALDVYQQIGASVNVTGVEWGIGTPWAQPEALAKAVGALFAELVQRRGYTCIKQWTLTNEPNTHFTQKGASFADYSRIHRLVAQEFSTRGLDIQIVGSDDTNGGLPWFQACVADPDYFAHADLFASHFYVQRDSLRAVKYHIDDRLQLLAGRKPFIIAEFGFQDARSSTLANPLMDEFDYALLSTAFALDAVAAGTAGLTLWCLHEVYYPNDWFMNYGLFKYKDNTWRPRPVFYAWANLTRHTRPGNAVQIPRDALPPQVSVVKIGETIYVVNQADTPVRLSFHGTSVTEARVFGEGEMPAPGATEREIRDAAAGVAVPIAQEGIPVPPRSFGFAR